MACKINGTLSTLRKISHELSLATSHRKIPTTRLPAVQYLLHEYRCYQVTEKQHCKAADELNFAVNAYLCYLKSSRKHQELLSHFHNRGERSIEATAQIVGFALPKSYES